MFQSNNTQTLVFYENIIFENNHYSTDMFSRFKFFFYYILFYCAYKNVLGNTSFRWGKFIQIITYREPSESDNL